MKNRLTKAISRESYKKLSAVGAAAGAGNRARTIPSKRDKQRDPHRLRREEGISVNFMYD